MDKNRFEVKIKQHISGGILKIIVDKETGVNYLSSSGIGVSGMCPLLDGEGRVIVDNNIKSNLERI